MKLQNATPDQSALVAKLVAALLTELSGGEAFDSSNLEPVAKSLLMREDVAGIVAFDGDSPVGLIMLNQCAAIYAGGVFGEITELYVVPDMRSKGVAAQLLDEAFALAKARGWKRLEVGAPDQPTWIRTFDFYQRNGFAEVGPRLRRLI